MSARNGSRGQRQKQRLYAVYSELTLRIPLPTSLAEVGSAVAPVWKNLPFSQVTIGLSTSTNTAISAVFFHVLLAYRNRLFKLNALLHLGKCRLPDQP
jgi:hypothetical protein